MSVYALNLFNVANRDDYRAYSRRSTAEVEARTVAESSPWASSAGK